MSAEKMDRNVAVLLERSGKSKKQKKERLQTPLLRDRKRSMKHFCNGPRTKYESLSDMTMMIREMSLGNGLIVRFFDLSRHYYGDFHLVKVEITCEIPLSCDYFDVQSDFEEACIRFGESVLYRRAVERMGIPSTAIEMVTEQLIENFVSHSLPYFAAPGFPRRFLKTELERSRKKQVLPSRVTAYQHD